MVFAKYQSSNNADSQLQAWIAAGDLSLIVKAWEWALFPAHNGTTDKNYLLTVKKYNANWLFTKNELVLVTHRVTDTFTITRSAWTCVQDETANPKIQWTTARSFDTWDTVSLYATAENDQDMKTEIARLETDKLNIADYQNGTKVFAASSTWNDDYVVAISPAPAAYLTGMTFRFQADVWNTWPATLKVNALAVINIKKMHDQELWTWDIEAWQIVMVSYDGTNFQMDSQIATLPTVDIHWATEKTDDMLEDDEFYMYDSNDATNKRMKKRKLNNSILDDTFFLWEAISNISNACVFIETWAAFVDATNKQNIWDVAWNTKVAFPVFIWAAYSSTFKVSICKTSSPSANLEFRLETDNAWAPSWSLVDANATATIAAASLTTSLADTTMTRTWAFTAPAIGTRCRLVINQNANTVNWTNYYNIWYITNDTTTRWLALWNSTRGAVTTTKWCYVYSTMFANKVLSLTDSDFAYKIWLYGVSIETKAMWTYPKLVMFWRKKTATWLTEDWWYFLSSTPWSISTTAWTNMFYVWYAINSTTLFVWSIIYPWIIADLPTARASSNGTSRTAINKYFTINQNWFYSINFTTSGQAWGSLAIYKNLVQVSPDYWLWAVYVFNSYFARWDIVSFRWNWVNPSYNAVVSWVIVSARWQWATSQVD